jgi:hypothetical protein
MPGSLSVANTAVSSINVAVVDSLEIGRTTVYIAGVTIALGHCLGVYSLWLRRVLCTFFQLTSESVCYANKI